MVMLGPGMINLRVGVAAISRCLACAWRLSWPLDAWRPLPPLRRERSECAAAAANGRAVVVAGGGGRSAWHRVGWGGVGLGGVGWGGGEHRMFDLLSVSQEP